MMGKKSEGQAGLNSLLGQGVECEGTARVEGTLRLDGSFRGNLEVGETLIIGEDGRFEGTAYCREIVVAGQFRGEVLGTDRVELQKGARMKGDVLTRSFVIEPGVRFEGNCRMEFTEAEEERLKVRPGGAKTDVGEEEEPVVRSLKK